MELHSLDTHRGYHQDSQLDVAHHSRDMVHKDVDQNGHRNDLSLKFENILYKHILASNQNKHIKLKLVQWHKLMTNDKSNQTNYFNGVEQA